MNKLTAVEHQTIFRLAEKKWKSARIAQILGRNPGTVAWFMYCNGLKAPLPNRKPTTYMRKGRTVRQYSADEDIFITVLRVQKYTFAKIADLASKRFGTERTAHSVHNRIIMLSARDAEEA